MRPVCVGCRPDYEKLKSAAAAPVADATHEGPVADLSLRGRDKSAYSLLQRVKRGWPPSDSAQSRV
jgi:hypothetical protein